MVKSRPASRRDRTKLTSSAKRAARKQGLRSRKGIASKDMNLHPMMRNEWDSHATPVANFRRIGLQSSVNSITKSRTITHRVVALPLTKEMKKGKTLQSLESEANRTEKERHQKMFQGETLAMQRMVDKHGDDWDAMARDTKLNYLQCTPRQLQKKWDRMQKVTKEREKKKTDAKQ